MKEAVESTAADLADATKEIADDLAQTAYNAEASLNSVKVRLDSTN